MLPEQPIVSPTNKGWYEGAQSTNLIDFVLHGPAFISKYKIAPGKLVLRCARVFCCLAPTQPARTHGWLGGV